MTTKEVQILYSQLSIHTVSEPEFSLWTDQHVSQGVAWRQGHVSFGIPDHDGLCLLDYGPYEQLFSDLTGFERLLCTPLTVETAGATIATFDEDIPANIVGGSYNIWFGLLPNFEFQGKKYAFKIAVRFERSPSPQFIILKKGAEMHSNEILYRIATVA
jgi:hypothetical protein